MIDRKIEETNPSHIPFKCPVCNGFGSLKFGEKVCHGCKGKGWVVVENLDRQKDEENKDRSF